MNALIKKFKEYGHMDGDVEKRLAGRVKCLANRKGDLLVKKGQVVSGLFVIESGFVRTYYTKGERETTSWFGFENIVSAYRLTADRNCGTTLCLKPSRMSNSGFLLGISMGNRNRVNSLWSGFDDESL